MAVDFSQWYEVTRPKVLGTLCAVSGDLDAAGDATDEAFVRALARWSRVQRMQSPEGWTFRVALNALRRELRRQARDRFEAERIAPRGRAGAVAPETDRELWVLVRALPDRQRTAIVLRYVADLPEADIATAMKVTRGTVSATLAQARARLAVQLADEPESAVAPSTHPHPLPAKESDHA